MTGRNRAIGVALSAAIIATLAVVGLSVSGDSREIALDLRENDHDAASLLRMPFGDAIGARVSRFAVPADDLGAATSPSNLQNAVTLSLVGLAGGSWDAITMLPLRAGLAPDSEVVAMIRNDFGNRPASARPANLATMTEEEILALRTADRGMPLKSIRPNSIAMVTIPAGSPPTIKDRYGDTARLESILKVGCSGRCVRTDIPFTSEFLARAEALGALDTAAAIIEGVAETGENVVLVVGLTRHPEHGWMPRWVISIAQDGAGKFYMPRI